jgi:hypothetical protein
MSRGISTGACLLLAIGLLAGDSPAPTGQARKLIETIRGVGKEGKGNAEAAKAWKALVAMGPAALAPILDALNDDEVVAGNWLQPAFEAITEKAATDGKFPTSVLEKALADTKKANIARSLAYAWLVKRDESVAARLLPGMLSDPAPDLRRLAVSYMVERADALRAGDEKDKTAKDLYRKAFRAAGDPEQIESIGTILTKLGEKADVAKQLGVVTRWHLVTPFDNGKGKGFDVAYAPENGVDLTATYKGKEGKAGAWVEHTTTDPQGLVDLKKVLGPLKGTVAYAYATIEMPEARRVTLRAGCINALKIFVNGKEVFALEEYHHGTKIDQYAVRVPLVKGKNEILLKVCQNEQNDVWAQSWAFQLRICDTVGCGVAFTQNGAKKENK